MQQTGARDGEERRSHEQLVGRGSEEGPGSGEEALAGLTPGACFGEMALFDRSERANVAIANTSCTLLTNARSDVELLLDFNRDIAYKVLCSVVRLLSARPRVTSDSLR